VEAELRLHREAEREFSEYLRRNFANHSARLWESEVRHVALAPCAGWVGLRG
jgi:hypothetical protein